MNYKVNHEPLSFWDGLFIMLVGLKLANLVSWSWWIAFLPMFIKLGGDIILLTLFYMFMEETEDDDSII